MRSGCSETQAAGRKQKSVPADQLENREIFIDGLNLFITIEAALSGGIVFIGRDVQSRTRTAST